MSLSIRLAGTLAAPLLAIGLAAPAAPAVAAAAAAPAMAAQPAAEPLPAFAFAGEVLDRDQLTFDPTGEFIFPSVFHAGAHLPDPLGEWYLYYAPHENPGGIALAYADSLAGPWTEHPANPLIGNSWPPHYGSVSHVSSPEAFWHPEEEQVFLYFHGENTTTRYATSADGVHFDYGGVAVTAAASGAGVTEASYARVFEHPDPAAGRRYGMFFMDNLNSTRRIRVATSGDARSWQVDPQPLVVPGAAEGANVSSADLWEWGGQLYVVYHASSGNIHARTVDSGLSKVGQSQILHRPLAGPPDRGRTASPQLVFEGEQLYLFYEAGSRLNATLAYAVADPDASPGGPGDDPLYEQCPGIGSDEFDGSGLDRTIWTRMIREEGDRHRISDGALHLPTYPTGVAGAPLIQQPVPEAPWEATVAVSIAPTASFHQAGLLLYADDDNYAKADLLFGSRGLTVEFIYRRGGTDRNTGADSFPAPAGIGDTVWFRLVSDGELVTASWSVDGRHFTGLGRPVEAAELGATHLGPYAMMGNTGASERTARFDWFRFRPSEAELSACQPPPGSPTPTPTPAGPGGPGGPGGGDGAGGELPRTGVPLLGLLAAAGLLIAAGTAGRLAARRR